MSKDSKVIILIVAIWIILSLVIFESLYPGPSFEDRREEKIWMPEDVQLEGPVESLSIRKSDVTRIVLSPDNFQKRFENETEVEILVVFRSREIWYIAEEENIIFLSQIKYPKTAGSGLKQAELSSFTLDEEGNVTAFYQQPEISFGEVIGLGFFSALLGLLLMCLSYIILLVLSLAWNLIRSILAGK